MNPFEYIKQRITDIADVNVAINGRDPSWGYADLMELLANIEEAYNDRYGSSDTISRQAAIDALKRLQKDISGDYTELDPMVMAGCGYIGDCIGELECLPSAQPEPKWIPCSERLPEEKDTRILKKLGINKQSDHVLTTVKVKGECMTVRACTYDGVWDWDMKHAFPDCEIIAWMPLPEPYKERRGK